MVGWPIQPIVKLVENTTITVHPPTLAFNDINEKKSFTLDTLTHCILWFERCNAVTAVAQGVSGSLPCPLFVWYSGDTQMIPRWFYSGDTQEIPRW
jgi:hypothetical protein